MAPIINTTLCSFPVLAHQFLINECPLSFSHAHPKRTAFMHRLLLHLPHGLIWKLYFSACGSGFKFYRWNSDSKNGEALSTSWRVKETSVYGLPRCLIPVTHLQPICSPDISLAFKESSTRQCCGNRYENSCAVHSTLLRVEREDSRA